MQGGEKKRRCRGAGGGEAIRWNGLQCRDLWLNGSCWDPAYTTGRMQSVPDLQSRCWAAAQSFQNIHLWINKAKHRVETNICSP